MWRNARSNARGSRSTRRAPTCRRFCAQDNLDYDKYREIRFRRDKALWGADDLPFRVEFFHPGYLYQEPVHINEFTLTTRAADPVRAGFF
jgi:glucan biosynthesis protein